jgi:hypothetical protein
MVPVSGHFRMAKKVLFCFNESHQIAVNSGSSRAKNSVKSLQFFQYNKLSKTLQNRTLSGHGSRKKHQQRLR